MAEILTKEQILQADDRRMEEVEVPEWGGKVMVRGLTGTERDEFETELLAAGRRGDYRGVRAKLVVRSIVDAAGAPLFTRADIDELGNKSGVALDRVFAVAQRLSGLRQKDIEELTADLPTGQSDGSTSA